MNLGTSKEKRSTAAFVFEFELLVIQNRPPGRVCVCVDLLKRSKTYTLASIYLSMLLLGVFITTQRHSSSLLFLFGLKKAGGQSSLMLLCPTKLCIKEGSQG